METILKALMPETVRPVTTRSITELVKEKDSLVLKVQAKDTVALRATLNAYLRWIGSVANLLKALEEIEN